MFKYMQFSNKFLVFFFYEYTNKIQKGTTTLDYF